LNTELPLMENIGTRRSSMKTSAAVDDGAAEASCSALSPQALQQSRNAPAPHADLKTYPSQIKMAALLLDDLTGKGWQPEQPDYLDWLADQHPTRAAIEIAILLDHRRRRFSGN